MKLQHGCITNFSRLGWNPQCYNTGIQTLSVKQRLPFDIWKNFSGNVLPHVGPIKTWQICNPGSPGNEFDTTLAAGPVETFQICSLGLPEQEVDSHVMLAVGLLEALQICS